MIEKFFLKNKTNGGIQNIHFVVNNIAADDLIDCADEDNIKSLCRSGCVNYGQKWSCPPNSPKISGIISKQGYDRVVLVCGYIELIDMKYIKNPYQRIKAANIILKSQCEARARDIEKATNGYALLSGSCNLCKPCYKKRGLPCHKPTLMRYSLESTGVNVELLAKKFCNHQLLWYQKGKEQMYTSVVVAVLVDGSCQIDYNTIFNT